MFGASPSGSSLRASPSFQSADLLAKAWALPVASRYAPLLSQGFRAICGPTSIANVLRSMGVAAAKNPLPGSGFRAMSLDQVAAESARLVPPGWQVSAVRPQSPDDLRAELLSSNDPAFRYIANFSRAPLFGRGGGHHSPIGGYLPEEDLVFVLDVNASYGPWLVSPERLLAALRHRPDWATGQSRGLARFQLRI